jgi:MinD superfamily P-loop ATPase
MMKGTLRTITHAATAFSVCALICTFQAVTHAQTVTGSRSFSLPVNISNSGTGKTEHWTFYWGANLQLTQSSPGVVNILLQWRGSGYHPAITDSPPDTCDPSTRSVSSNQAKITFANGTVFDTADGSLSSTNITAYGYDHAGTYYGNIGDLGTSAYLYLNAGVTYSGRCGSSTFGLDPSGFSVPLN